MGLVQPLSDPLQQFDFLLYFRHDAPRSLVCHNHFDMPNSSAIISQNFCMLSQDIIALLAVNKEPKTRAGDRYVYFSAEMESPLREYRQECAYITETYDQRQLTADDFLFRRQGAQLPMTPTTFTWRFKLILKKNCLPQELNVHSLRHTAASLMIAGGADVATVAGILGHSQPSTTLDIYTHAFDKNKKAASAGLQEMLEI